MENDLYASKRRGRPVGSKNKRKEPEPSAGVQQDGVAMQMKVLEVAAGADVISAVSDFANRFKGNFYGSLSFATRPSPISTSHLIYIVDGEGNAVGGIVAGRVLAATKVLLVVTILRETDCIKLPLAPPSPPANNPIVNARQPEICSSARGSMSAYGVPCPTPHLRQLLLLGVP
ncbi:hypothetical protein L1987_78709 [Smallanthus sonchifolius]|uniref:Uncharacterized protein n=1 Tax=Smallanthus sonchifolius TaxID=185202 RepID=A0ACB8ZHX0_9ASTR|nr:hypothetical protein L1987_78709 [Smallanthus sonchifolius]